MTGSVLGSCQACVCSWLKKGEEHLNWSRGLAFRSVTIYSVHFTSKWGIPCYGFCPMWFVWSSLTVCFTSSELLQGNQAQGYEGVPFVLWLSLAVIKSPIWQHFPKMFRKRLSVKSFITGLFCSRNRNHYRTGPQL